MLIVTRVINEWRLFFPLNVLCETDREEQNSTNLDTGQSVLICGKLGVWADRR